VNTTRPPITYRRYRVKNEGLRNRTTLPAQRGIQEYPALKLAPIQQSLTCVTTGGNVANACAGREPHVHLSHPAGIHLEVSDVSAEDPESDVFLYLAENRNAGRTHDLGERIERREGLGACSHILFDEEHDGMVGCGGDPRHDIGQGKISEVHEVDSSAARLHLPFDSGLKVPVISRG
jgi:hypothetical protein